MRFSSQSAVLMGLLLVLCSSCDGTGLATYCDPKYKVFFDYPSDRKTEVTGSDAAINVKLVGESDSGASEISVSLAETTEDARRMGTAAGRIGTITSLSQGRIEIGEFNVDHPEYDVAGVLLDHGTRQVNMAYAVIGSPAVIEVIATQRADPELSPEQTEVLRAIVRSLRRDVQARCG